MKNFVPAQEYFDLLHVARSTYAEAKQQVSQMAHQAFDDYRDTLKKHSIDPLCRETFREFDKVETTKASLSAVLCIPHHGHLIDRVYHDVDGGLSRPTFVVPAFDRVVALAQDLYVFGEKLKEIEDQAGLTPGILTLFTEGIHLIETTSENLEVLSSLDGITEDIMNHKNTEYGVSYDNVKNVKGRLKQLIEQISELKTTTMESSEQEFILEKLVCMVDAACINEGKPDHAFIDELNEYDDFFMGPGETDSFGWLTAIVKTPFGEVII